MFGTTTNDGNRSSPTAHGTHQVKKVSSAGRKKMNVTTHLSVFGCDNDPSAGSPTETLLRLHLPLND